MNVAQTDIFLAFMVLTRALAMISMIPLFGGKLVPLQVKIAFAGGLAFIIYPLFYGQVSVPTHGLSLGIAIVNEALVGFLMGFAIRMIFFIAEFGGTIISTEAGLMRSDIFDPMMQTSSTAVGMMLFFLAMMLIMITGVHYQIIDAFVASYRKVPINGTLPALKGVDAFVKGSSEIFLIGLKIAAPIVAMNL